MLKFHLLNFLDELKAVDKLSAEYLKNVHYLSAAEKSEAMEKIQKIFRKAVAYGDDKVQLAMQTYEMVCNSSVVKILYMNYVLCKFKS